MTSRERFEAIIRAAAAQRVPVAVHAIGDRANRDALDAGGSLADLVVLDRDPHADLDGAQVLAPMVGGEWTHRIP